MMIIWQKQLLPRQNMFLEVFLVLETEQKSAGITIYDIRGT